MTSYASAPNRVSSGVSIKGEVKFGSELVIVAGQSTDNPPPPLTHKVGMWFDGGFDTPAVPVILVSDGTISLARIFTGNTVTVWFSMFAADVHVYLDKNVIIWSLLHPPLLEFLNVDPLVDHQLLPNTLPGQNRRLDRVVGTWSLVTKSDPDN